MLTMNEMLSVDLGNNGKVSEMKAGKIYHTRRGSNDK